MLNRETMEFVAAHRHEETRALALKAKRLPGVDMQQALTQIEGWQTAREKLPAWAATEGIIYPPRISMEQCSSEATALYKSNIAKGESVADLTGGFGIDCSYIARGFRSATYIERNPLLCGIARENFALLGLDHITVINGDSQELFHSLPSLDWIFIDPARRDGDGRKVVALSDCEPDVTALEEELLAKAHRVMVKCSPMLDITAACRQLKHVSAVHIVAVNNECKELLLILERASNGAGITTTCTDIRKEGEQRFTYTAEEGNNSITEYSGSIARYLYEPNAAILKSGCHAILAQRHNISKLHPNSQLYTADHLEKDFPGRTFNVEKVYGFSKAELKEVQALEQANITVRNFPENVAQLRRRLKLAEGGERYIFATTLSGGEKVLAVCSKVKHV